MPKTAENANATTTALTVIVAIAALALCGLWFKTPARADTESQYYANLEAFQTTNASRDQNCQSMIQISNTITTAPPGADYNMPWLFGPLVVNSYMCFNDVRAETGGASLPARIPMSLFVSACKQIHLYLKSGALRKTFTAPSVNTITQDCAGVP